MPEADSTARFLAERGITVASLDYALAAVPKDPRENHGAIQRGGAQFPVASDQVVAGFRWAVGSALAQGPWALGGASAGGNLAAGAALELRSTGGPMPDLLLLAYPTLHVDQDPPSDEVRAALGARLSSALVDDAHRRALYENYLGRPATPDDVRAVPGLAPLNQLAGLPPTILIASEADELRTSAAMFAHALRQAHVPVELFVEPGTVHGHLNDRGSDAAVSTLTRFTDRLLALRPQKVHS